MLYADDAAVVLQSPEQPRKRTGVLVIVCAAFLVSPYRRPRLQDHYHVFMQEGATAIFSAGQVFNQTNEFVYIAGNVNNAVLSMEVDRRIRNAWHSFRMYTLELYDLPSDSFWLEIRMLRAEVIEIMLYDCVTWSPRACQYDTLCQAHHSFLAHRIGWRSNNRTNHPTSYMSTLLMTTGREGVETIMRRRRILFAGFVARMEDTRLPKCDVHRIGGRRGLREGAGEIVDGCLLDDLRAFGINADQGTIGAQDEGEWRKTSEEQGAERFMVR